MTFLAQAWLLSLAALALPIALHLISRGRTRRVRVPSIRLLTVLESRKARRLRPTDFLLLALRCALLTALALALAAPRWSRAVEAEGGADWALVAPSLWSGRASIEAGAGDAYARIDQALAAGAELRWLAPGFPRVRSSSMTHAETMADPEDVWSLLAEADTRAPVGAAFHVLLPDRLETLRGARPALSRSVSWIAIPASGTNRWIERAASDSGAAGGDGPRSVLVARSDRERTTYSRETLPEDDTAAAGPDAPIVARVFHAPDRAEDAGYVRAALVAAAEQASIPLMTLTVSTAPGATEDSAEAVDLLFWLSPVRVPERVAARVAGSGVLVSDGGERSEFCDGTIVLPYADDVTLRRCSPPADPGLDGADDPGDDAVPVWTDAGGRPVLDTRRMGPAVHYRLHGRFNPSWSDLPSHAALPAFVLELVTSVGDGTASGATERSDLRAAGSQGRPRLIAADAEATVESAAPQYLMWLLAALLLVAERRLAAGSAP